MGLSARQIEKLISNNTGWGDYVSTVYSVGSPLTLQEKITSLTSDYVELPNFANTIRDDEKSSFTDAYYIAKIFTVSSSVGLAIGETLTGGTSGNTALIERIVGNLVYVNRVSGIFTDTETLEGSVSGSVPTLTSQAQGGITGINGNSKLLDIEFKIKPNGAAGTPRIKVVIDIGGAVGFIYPREQILSKGDGEEHNYLAAFGVYTLDTWEANLGKPKILVKNEAVDIYDVRYIFYDLHRKRIVD